MDNKSLEIDIDIMPESFTGSIIIDNGSTKAQFDQGAAHSTLSRLVGEDAASKLCWEVARFKKEVDKEREKGIALGSSDLVPAVDSLYYASQGEMKDPKNYGLETNRELKLAARVVSSFVKPI